MMDDTWIESTGTPMVRTVMRSSLRCTRPSASNRRRAQELAWRWVGTKWPRLVPASGERDGIAVERAAPGQELMATTSADGGTWTLSLAHASAKGDRTWLIEAEVANADGCDVLRIQTSWAGDADGPVVVAPPRLMRLWVENLEIDDDGVAVTSDPHSLDDHGHAEAFCEHVLSGARTLPIVALSHGAHSRSYGVDPRTLAESLSGLAHVVCLSPAVAELVSERLGKALAPNSGAARIYAPGFDPADTPDDHPLIKTAKRRAGEVPDDAGSTRRLLVQQVCGFSVRAANRRTARG